MWIEKTLSYSISSNLIANEYTRATGNDPWADALGSVYALPARNAHLSQMRERGDMKPCLLVAAADEQDTVFTRLVRVLSENPHIGWTAWLNTREIVILLDDAILARDTRAWWFDDWSARELSRVADPNPWDGSEGNVFALPDSEDVTWMLRRYGASAHHALEITLTESLFGRFLWAIRNSGASWRAWRADRRVLMLQG